ncbi:MAG TPA: chloride channel protein [Candidatus Angelobacter sp.]|nr:chloride channel protein [Candidatus Angelobacter sp.]
MIQAEGPQQNMVQRLARRWMQIPSEQRENQVFLALTLVIGCLVGLAVVAFIVLTEGLGMRLYPVGSAPWRRFLIPVAGSLAMGYLLFRYFPNARGSGVPQTKAALFARDGFISLRTVLGKFGCTAGTLACGIPLGREGPSVQVGAGIASVLGRLVGFRPEKVKALLPVGASAAIAAAFNTPMAAVVFSLEEVMGDLNAPVLGSVVLASAMSWVMVRRILGNNPLFHVPQYELVNPVEFAIYAVLGVAGGFLSSAFTALLLGMRKRFLLSPKRTWWWHPVTGGLAVGLMGLMVPQVLGVGYSYVGDALNGNMAVKLMALLVVLKLFAVTVSYASGNAGGIFGPSLFLGAMLGGSVGSVAHHFFPAYTATAGAYALVGMGALFAGIVRAPMTSVLMIFEMTRDYSVIVPLMIANLASLYIASRFQKEPIYEALAHQDGIHLPNSKGRSDFAQRKVFQLLRAATDTLPAQMMVREALERAGASQFHSWPIMDESRVVGVLSLKRLESAAADGGAEQQLICLLETLEFPHVHQDHAVHLALERMSSYHLDILPVVNRVNVHQLEGVITLHDVLDSYGVDSRGSA